MSNIDEHRRRVQISLHFVIIVISRCRKKYKLKMPGGKSGGCVWNSEFSEIFPGFTSAKNGKKDHCHCKPCGKDLSIFHKGKTDIANHIKTKDHIANCKKVAGTQTLDKLFNGRVFNIVCLFTVCCYFFL